MKEQERRQAAISNLEKVTRKLAEKRGGRKFCASPVTKQFIRNMVGVVEGLERAAAKSPAKGAASHATPRPQPAASHKKA